MARTPLGGVLECVRALLASQQASVLPDRQLLDDFVERRDECAFTALVRRHGAMVLYVCRRAVRDAADAEDAFQATFLVLARKAASIRKREALSSWLHGVAYRVARKLRADRARRERKTGPLVDAAEPDTTADVTWREIQGVLDEELARLPEAYRAPLVLCYLEGKTQDEAARELGWSLGALRGRLERGRERLRGRLLRRGLTLSAALFGATLAQATASGPTSAALEVSAVKAALLAATGGPVPAGAASAQVVALGKGVITAMFIHKLWATAVLLLGVGALGGGGLLTYQAVLHATQAGASAQAAPAPAEREIIRDLIRQLGDDSFERREAASKRLVAIGEPALEILRQAAQDSADAEVRRRAGQAARAIEMTLFGEVRQLGAHGGQDLSWVGRVAVTPDGRRAVSGGYDALRCWDLAGRKQLLVFGESQAGYWSMAVSADGKRVIAGNNDRVARVFDLETGLPVQQLIGHTGEVWGAALSADGKRAVTGAWDQSLRVWDVETGKEVRAFTGVRGRVRCLALSPDGKWVAAGHFTEVGKPAAIRLWDMAKGEEIRAFEGHTQEVSSVAFAPDGKTLLSSGFDKTVRLWDVASGKELKRLEGHTWRVEYAAFSPDGKRVVSAGNERDPVLRLWDVASGKQLLASEEVEGGFLGVAVLPDGRHCVTTGKDGVVRLWRWAR